MFIGNMKEMKMLKLMMALLFFCFSAEITYASNTQYALAMDTIAGESTYLKAINYPSDTKIGFYVQKPDESVVTVMSTTDSFGQANALLSDYHTSLAGNYLVYASLVDGTMKTATTNFNVSAGVFSSVRSMISASANVLKADGTDYAIIEITPKDSEGNSIHHGQYKIISSRSTDLLEPKVASVNSSGKAVFKVSSKVAGKSTIMAFDLAEGDILEQREELLFVDSNRYIAEAGGDLFEIAYAASSGPLNGFEISDLPSTVDVNDQVSFTVRAIDEDELTVENYTGTVRFSVEGESTSGVSLPDNYKFLAEDLGEHTFSLGLRFAEAGTYNIVANDLNDKYKIGEVLVNVGDIGSSDSGSTSDGAFKPVITSPVEGTYSQSELIISGNAKAGASLRIYDNEEKLGSLIVSPNGKFSYQTESLASGEHRIYVVAVDQISLDVLGTSDEMFINIDVTAPEIESIELDPNKDINPGDVIDVKIYSAEKLSQAALIFNFDIIELSQSIEDSSAYVGSIQAPNEPGIYKISVLLVDELQNEITYDDQITIDVGEGEADVTTVDDNNGDIIDNTVNDTDTIDEVVNDVVDAPSIVKGLMAYGNDKKVVLVWDAATDNNKVENYKIYFGLDYKNLDQYVITKDASNTWYIPNLENNKEYFFAVAAIDDEGNESESRSEVVSAIPFMLEISNALSGENVDLGVNSDNDVNVHPAFYAENPPPSTSNSGPFTLPLLIISGSAAVLLKRK